VGVGESARVQEITRDTNNQNLTLIRLV